MLSTVTCHPHKLVGSFHVKVRGQGQSPSLTGQGKTYVCMKLEKHLSNQCQSVLKRKQVSLESYIRKSFYSYISLEEPYWRELLADDNLSLSPCSISSDSFRFRDLVHLGVLFVLLCLFGRATEEMQKKKLVSLGIPICHTIQTSAFVRMTW